jgi:hypothetical protein
LAQSQKDSISDTAQDLQGRIEKAGVEVNLKRTSLDIPVRSILQIKKTHYYL